jgi:glycosyltransferase involved in cell wall biosynthesis
LSRPQRILVVSNLLPPQVEGGAELVASSEIQGLRALGREVRALTATWPADRVGGYAEIEDASGIEAVPVPPRGARGRAFSRRPANEFARNPTLTQAFASQVEEFRPDLVHVHNLSGFTLHLLGIAQLPRRTALVATFHDGWGICPRTVLTTQRGQPCAGGKAWACVPCVEGGRPRLPSTRRGLLLPLRNGRVRRAMRRADRLIFPSRHHLELYAAAGYPRERCHLLRNPAPEVSGDIVPPPGERAGGDFFELAFLGTTRPHKGIGVLLDALVGLPPGFRLVVHGPVSSGLLRQFDAAVERRGLEPRVRHCGWAPPRRAAEAIVAADAVVVPSLAIENCPLTVLEAMAIGRPVVASNVGGIPELVQHGETGLLFQRGDAGDLREQLLQLRGDRELAAKLGAAGRRVAAALGLEPHLDGLEAIYAEAHSQAKR